MSEKDITETTETEIEAPIEAEAPADAEVPFDPEASLDGEDAEGGTIIRDTDIVFDCPHCGHNLAIDYRGAGLQINCVNCGESVLVPIPGEMKIDDLDLEPGEILKQLFATRRNLQKAETMAETLAARIDEMTRERESREAALATLELKVDELKQLCLQQATVNDKMSVIVSGLLGARPDDVQTAPDAAAPAAE